MIFHLRNHVFSHFWFQIAIADAASLARIVTARVADALDAKSNFGKMVE